MLKYNKRSEEINPWTFRKRQTSVEFNQFSTDADNHLKNLQNVNRQQKPSDQNCLLINRSKIQNNFKNMLPQRTERIISNRIPVHSINNQALVEIQKIVPSYKFINFQYRFKPLRKKSKAKKGGQVFNSLRQYTQSLDALYRKDQLNESLKNLKPRRFFTQEKIGEDNFELKGLTRNEDLFQKNKTEQLRKLHQIPIKIIKISRSNHSREQIITKGKLYDQVHTICDRKGVSGGGHLSQMKRKYNIKKLQKLIKQDQLLEQII